MKSNEVFNGSEVKNARHHLTDKNFDWLGATEWRLIIFDIIQDEENEEIAQKAGRKPRQYLPDHLLLNVNTILMLDVQKGGGSRALIGASLRFPEIFSIGARREFAREVGQIVEENMPGAQIGMIKPDMELLEAAIGFAYHFGGALEPLLVERILLEKRIDPEIRRRSVPHIWEGGFRYRLNDGFWKKIDQELISNPALIGIKINYFRSIERNPSKALDVLATVKPLDQAGFEKLKYVVRQCIYEFFEERKIMPSFEGALQKLPEWMKPFCLQETSFWSP